MGRDPFKANRDQLELIRCDPGAPDFQTIKSELQAGLPTLSFYTETIFPRLLRLHESDAT